MDNEFEFDREQDTGEASAETPMELPAETPAASLSGDPAETPPAPPKRRGPAGWLIGVVAAVVVLVLAVVLGGKALAGGSVLQRSAKGLAANETLVFLSELCKNGTVGVELGLEELLGYDGTVSAEWKNDFSDQEKARAALDLGLALKGNQVADLSVYADEGQLILSSDALLPEQSLGLDLAHLSENMDKSIFNPDSGSDYAMDRESFEVLKNSFSRRGTVEPETLKKQMERLYNDAAKMLHKSFKTHVEQERDSETLRFSEQDVKVNVRSYQVDAEGLYGLLLDTLAWAKDSRELRSFLDTVWPVYAVYLEDWAEDPDGLCERLNEYYSELKDGREEFLRENAELELKLRIYISKGKGELLGLKLEWEQDREEGKAEAFWGPSLAEINSISFKYDNGYGEYSGSYTVKVNNQQSFSAVLKLRENSHAVFEGGFQWDKKDGGFTLTAGDFSLKGSLEALEDGYLAQLRELYANGGSQKIDLRLSLRRSAAFDAPPVYREMTQMSEEDIQELLEELQGAAYMLLLDQNVSGLLYGLLA